MSESIPQFLSHSSPKWFMINDARARFAMAKARICYDLEAMRRARAKCVSRRPVEDEAVVRRRREKIAFAPDRHRALVIRRLETRLPRQAADAITFDRLQRAVSRATGFSMGVLKSRRRDIPVSAARGILIWLTRRHTKASLPMIGRRLNRDHSTVKHNIDRVEAIRSGDDCMWPALNIRIRRDLARVEALLG